MGSWAPLRGVLLTAENGRLTPLTALQLLPSMLWLPPVLNPDQADTKAVPSEAAAAAGRADNGVAATLPMLAAQHARPTRADWVNSCIMFLSGSRNVCLLTHEEWLCETQAFLKSAAAIPATVLLLLGGHSWGIGEQHTYAVRLRS